MNIIYVRMTGYDWVSVPSDAVARELERLGHKITLVESLQYIPPDDYDFVITFYESVTLIGDAISKKLGIPHYAHVEVLPPWRVREGADIANYGLTPDDPEVQPKQLANTIMYYRDVGEAWKNAAIKSVSNHCRVKFHEDLLGIEDLQLRYPSIDVASIERAKQMYNPQKLENNIITVSRATSIKRYDLLLQVMNLVKTPVAWTIIGDGPMLDVIKTGLTNSNVSLDLKKAQWGWVRYYEIMKAKLMVYAMGGMPPIEAALLGTFPIVIENPPTDDLPEFNKFMRYNFGFNKDNYETTFFPIFQHDEIEKMAAKIDEELAKPTGQSLAENATVTAFMCGSMNVTSSRRNAEQLVERMEAYLNV